MATDANSIISGTNAKIAGAFTGVNVLNVVGWFVFVILIIGGAIWAYMYYKNKKLFSKNITAFEIVGAYWQPVLRDRAKIVKIGKGGFEILFLKKAKTWKIAYGGRVGKDTYYFFIMPDGYWYNGMLYANISKMDEKGGLIPIVTTNPLMRGQYTALEKQVDALHGEKKSFWDKYGSWILGIAFVLIAGVLLWLNYREFSNAMGKLGSFIDAETKLLDKLNVLTTNVQTTSGGSGLVKV